jgi:L-gulonate 5-dehydrogenase
VKAVVLEKPRTIQVTEPDPPHRADGQALVRLRLAGICGSDLAAYRGVSPLVRYPRVLGHELLVDIVEAPDRPDLVGKRAVVEPLLPCGTCRVCRRGRYNCCPHLQVMGVHVDGGLRDLTAINISQLYPVPNEMPDQVAVLAEPTSIAYRAVQRSEIEAGHTAVVFGAGAVGLLIAQLLVRGRGCRALVIDIDPWRLRVAEAVGGIPLAGDREHLMNAVAKATGGEMASVVFEVTGNAICTRMTTDLVAYTGRIILIGWNKGPTEIDTVTLMQKEVELRGSRNSTGAFPPVLQLLADSMVDPDLLITHHFGLGEAAAAFTVLDQGQEPALKILIAE